MVKGLLMNWPLCWPLLIERIPVNNVFAMPIWKKNSTPAEWLGELASMAIERPERFSRMVVYFEEIDKNGDSHFRHAAHNVKTNSDIMGFMETAKFELFEHMKGRNVE